MEKYLFCSVFGKSFALLAAAASPAKLRFRNFSPERKKVGKRLLGWREQVDGPYRKKRRERRLHPIHFTLCPREEEEEEEEEELEKFRNYFLVSSPLLLLERVFSYVFWARFLTTLLDPHKVLNLKYHFEFSFPLRHFWEIPFMLSAFFSGENLWKSPFPLFAFQFICIFSFFFSFLFW